MKKILILLLFCGFWANAQQYHDKGAKFENATNEGDTITVNTRIPIIDEFGLINYYVDVADLLALNPAPTLEWGNITGTLSNQTDLQGALNDKADQSALTAHTSNGNIHFTQSEIDITESQISDLKDYLRGDVNDTNGANKLTLGSLEVVGQTTLQNGLNLTSIPTGTSDNILTINGSGDVEQRVFSLGDIDIANASGVSQFPVGLGDQLRIQGSGDTSISFDGVTNTINITSIPGSGGGGAVTSFNGRTGGVVSQAGDYSTAMVNENTNLYFTEARVRGTDLSGLTVANTPISSTNTFIQALGRLQGQINDRVPNSRIISTGLYLSGGGDLASNKTISFVPTVNNWVLDNEGNQRMFLGGTISSNGVLFQASALGQEFQYRNSLGTKQFWVTDTGSINGSNIITSGSGNFGSTVSITGSAPQINFNETGGTSNWRIINDANAISFRKSGVADTQFILRDTGEHQFYGNITATNLSGTNTGDQTWTTLSGKPSTFTPSAHTHPASDITSGTFANARISASSVQQHISASTGINISGGSISVTNIAAGSSTVGALRYNGTTKAAGMLYGGSSNPSNTTRLNYDGSLYVSNLTSIGDVVANSDKRLKKNIKRIDNALSIVQLLGGYEYDRKDIDLHQAGVIAQEVEEVFPVAVSEDKKGIKSVAYNQLIALLIEAIKQQQIEIENLKTLINEK